jgi:hypothetical protein
MTDLRGVYVFTPTGVGGHGLGAFLVNGKQAAFTTSEKADAFRRTHKELLKGWRKSRCTLCQSEVCVPAVIDPK